MPTWSPRRTNAPMRVPMDAEAVSFAGGFARAGGARKPLGAVRSLESSNPSPSVSTPNLPARGGKQVADGGRVACLRQLPEVPQCRVSRRSAELSRSHGDRADDRLCRWGLADRQDES